MNLLVLTVVACLASGKCAEHTAPLPLGTVVDPSLPRTCLLAATEWQRANPRWKVRFAACGPLEYRL